MKKTKDQKIKALKEKIKANDSHSKLWGKMSILSFNQTHGYLIAARKSVGILLPLIEQSKIEDLLGELYDLRVEKENWELSKKIEEVINKGKKGV